MAGFSTDDLIRTVQSSTAASNRALLNGAEQLNASTDQAQALLESSTQQIRQSIDATKQIQQGQAEVGFQQQQVVETLQNLYNMNPEVVSNEIATSLATANLAREERKGVRAEYDRLNQIDFFSDPLGFLVAQTQLPTVAKRNNALADTEDEALQEIQTRTSLLNASKSTVVANTADAAKALQLQTADVNAQVANAQLDQKTADNIVRISSTRMQALQLADKVGDNTRSSIGVIANLQNAAETRAMRQEANKDREVERQLREENLRTLLAKRKADAAEEAALNSQLDIVSKSLGLKLSMTADGLRQMTDKKAQAAWYHAATTGQFGDSLRESVVFYQDKGNLPEIANRGDRSVISTVQKLDRAGAGYVDTVAGAYKAANGGKALTPEQARELAYTSYQNELLDSTASGTTTADLSSSKWDRTYNPYVAQFTGFSKAIDLVPEFAGLKNNLVKKQVDTLIAAGAVKGENLTSEQQKQVVDSVSKQVQARAVTSAKAAADIAAFMKGAADYNLRLNKYNLFALPPQQTYLFTLPDAGRVDLLNPTEVERQIMKSVQRKYESVNLFNDPGTLGVFSR